MIWIGILIGMIVGAALGLFGSALCRVSGRADDTSAMQYSDGQLRKQLAEANIHLLKISAVTASELDEMVLDAILWHDAHHRTGEPDITLLESVGNELLRRHQELMPEAAVTSDIQSNA